LQCSAITLIPADPRPEDLGRPKGGAGQGGSINLPSCLYTVAGYMKPISTLLTPSDLLKALFLS